MDKWKKEDGGCVKACIRLVMAGMAPVMIIQLFEYIL